MWYNYPAFLVPLPLTSLSSRQGLRADLYNLSGLFCLFEDVGEKMVFAGFVEVSFGFWVARHQSPGFCETQEKLSNVVKEKVWEKV